MSNTPGDLRYTSSHEWARVEGSSGVATIGITWFAQDSLGDVVHVELPKVGTSVHKGQSVAEIESVKAVSEIYSPVSGEVVAVNADLDGSEELVNSAPFADGWLFQVKMSHPAELDEMLASDAYETHVAASAH